MSSKTAQKVRSDTVAYWTGGKDIEVDYNNLAKPEYYRNGEARRNRYLERLEGTLVGSQESGGQPGLWMKSKPIILYAEPSFRSVMKWPFTCFTEAWPEDSLKHIKRYGHLGFVFDREFILKHYGAPVLYIPGKNEMPMVPKNGTVVSRHAIKIHQLSDFLAKKTTETIKETPTGAVLIPREECPVYCKFEEFIRACRLQEYLFATGYKTPDWNLFASLRASIMTVSIFLKAMSEEDCSEQFELMEEFEWRIPYVIGKPCFTKTKRPNPPYVIPFNPRDLQRLVVRDQKTLNSALKNKNIFKRFGDISSKITTVRKYTNP